MLVVVGAAGCGGPRTDDTDVQAVRYDRLREMLDREGTLLVDVRGAEAFAAGRLPRSVNVPFPAIRRRYGRLDDAGRIVVYGEDWRDPLPIAAAKRLIALGYDNVFEFKGGVELWTDSGGELIRGED